MCVGSEIDKKIRGLLGHVEFVDVHTVGPKTILPRPTFHLNLTILKHYLALVSPLHVTRDRLQREHYIFLC